MPTLQEIIERNKKPSLAPEPVVKAKVKVPPKARVSKIEKELLKRVEALENKLPVPISEIGSMVESTISQSKNGKWTKKEKEALKIKKWMEDLVK